MISLVIQRREKWRVEREDFKIENRELETQDLRAIEEESVSLEEFHLISLVIQRREKWRSGERGFQNREERSGDRGFTCDRRRKKFHLKNFI